ncbi:threonine--tRNA ligase [Pontibacillus sp. HMF3514]|uniref:threonine--tRNA ligase n=1 Tax=Pontibacillus sp. HMF3514 TaxID=2692425 RepID=UPI00132034B4|nr:threonine--tRNA ligase [Pontibacillus sp. HMF3514]QHE53370.1 threonine--tRNA ligase [Pontibacillus sp. HMF3514]
MNDIKIVFPDGNQKAYQKGITLEKIAQSISPSLRKKSVAGKVNGELYDFRRPIENDAAVELLQADSDEGKELLRHTSAHVMAQAVKRLYGGVQLGVGPVIENGFYYDMDLAESISEEDLPKIEKEMNKIIQENLIVERKEVSREEAQSLLEGDALKIEILKDLPEGAPITVYQQGEFLDLCRGPHLPSTGLIKSFKLMSVAGAYWKGDSKNKMLQRIYGVAFPSQTELNDYLKFLDEAAKRNHRKLGKELELFMFSEEAPGMPFYKPNGQVLRNELEFFIRDLHKYYDYQEVRTPQLMNQRLWEQSGHWDHYKENMYFSDVDHASFALKPMNCPGHMLMYNDQLHSYRDLPLRMAEFGQVHRHEYSGALNGLLRVRSFCQDDAHIFATPQQIEGEIKTAVELIDHVYKVMGFEYELELSTRPEKAMGSDELWDQAEGALKNVLQALEFDYRINEGDGAFYGPKIDFHIKDALNRSHQCGTIQLDFQMPEKFDLNYIDENNEKVRPVVIHRAVFGSIDRFLGILIEHFGGAFPTWLAPVQAKIIPVSNQVHSSYALEIVDQLKKEDVRVDVDLREEKMGYKIREAQMKKIPYILVVGDQEREQGAVNVREYGKESSQQIGLEEFVQRVREEIELKK